MIAVVTGTSGFIGSHLADALLARGAQVRALVRPASGPSQGGARGGAKGDSRVERHVVDLLDPRAVRESPVWAGATHVFHVGGVTVARTQDAFRAGNVQPVTHILASLAALARPPRLVLVSSQAAAGPARSANAPVRESDAPDPIEPYGRSKLEAEGEALRHQARVPVVIARPAAVYGPRDRAFLAAFREAASRVAFHAAPRDQQFSLVHVHDLVDALVRAATSAEAPGRTYFIGDDRPVTWRALYAAIARASGSTPLQVQLPAAVLRAVAAGGDLVAAVTGRTFLLNSHKVALAAPRWWLCDTSRAREELGWRPQVVLHEGVQDTYDWYVRAGWLSGQGPFAGARPPEESDA